MIKFISGGNEVENERVRIDSAGHKGLGTREPKVRLQVADGDIYISDIENGLIMKSPDGTCWGGLEQSCFMLPEGSYNFRIYCSTRVLIFSAFRGRSEYHRFRMLSQTRDSLCFSLNSILILRSIMTWPLLWLWK